MTTPPTPTLAEVEAALHRSQDRLAAAVSVLADEELTGPSYDAGWTVADVLSHLGSGAAITGLSLDAGLGRREAPEFEELDAIWTTWNAKAPHDQAADAVAANAALLERLGGLTDAQRGAFAVDMFNGRQDLLGLLLLRLSEHAVHTWDVLVARDPAARLAPDATALLLTGLDELVSRAGQRSEVPLRVAIRTTGPEAAFVLEADGDGPRLTVGPGDAPATATLPAEAFIRLVYGRLDDAHADQVQVEGCRLADLRAVFPGF
ncbi:TIGR03083 family protein [Friedmanniella luteola]|uniref:TIGR03083 family protein n=1 Tax=Friedmanniella luteola TaxID=546871 RepID=A0A1H1L7W1_9ACTN|nr:maleylpyruvate isomerase family mycothiol-dependent enzyme [Friedmanniella luteola]SDR69969.1 TIGR03083 family protein [Friedmanniella luteola]